MSAVGEVEKLLKDLNIDAGSGISESIVDAVLIHTAKALAVKKSINAVACALWRGEAIRSGAPQGLIDNRTPEEFANQADKMKEAYRQQASVVIVQVLNIIA